MRAGIAGIAALGVALAIGASAQGPEDARPILEASNLETTVRQLATDLSTVCPLADPGDQTALDGCRMSISCSIVSRGASGRAGCAPYGMIVETAIRNAADKAFITKQYIRREIQVFEPLEIRPGFVRKSDAFPVAALIQSRNPRHSFRRMKE